MKGVVATTSPSMDIQVSSNFERYLYEASGRDAARVRALMQDLAADRRFELGPLWDALKADFNASSASEADVADCIRRCYRDHKYLLDPHTACGVVAAERANLAGETVVLATAHPAKFPDALEAMTGSRPALPNRLSELDARPRTHRKLPNDLAAVEDFIERAVHRKEPASA